MWEQGLLLSHRFTLIFATAIQDYKAGVTGSIIKLEIRKSTSKCELIFNLVKN